jgi:hypothetical protein
MEDEELDRRDRQHIKALLFGSNVYDDSDNVETSFLDTVMFYGDTPKK